MADALSLTPFYGKPSPDRLEFARQHLATIEQSLPPKCLVDATDFVRAMMGFGCNTAEAMWGLHEQIEAGRYKPINYEELKKMQLDADCERIYDWNFPCNIELLPGKGLHLKGSGNNPLDDWCWVGFLMPRDRLSSSARQSRVSLTKEAAGVLLFLARNKYVLSTLDDIELGAEISRTTAAKACDELIATGCANRPSGRNKGLAATEAGLDLAEKIGTKSVQT